MIEISIIFGYNVQMSAISYITPAEALASLGQNVRQIRLLRNWTQRELAARAGVSYSSLRRLEDSASIGLADTLRVLEVLNLLSPLVSGVEETADQARRNALSLAPETAERKHAYPTGTSR